uniref:cystatin-B-like n=1 Tax=Styela clava TaxID=7725 RepID=UPI0019395E4F|nr:cystatin-B-like [Styela clava]
MEQTTVGGLSEEHVADEEVKKLCESVKDAAIEEAGIKYETFTPIAYKTQVVAGMNYFVKVQVGSGEKDYIVLRIFKSLEGEATLSNLQKDQTKDSPIEYF